MAFISVHKLRETKFTMLITVCRWTRSRSERLFEANAWRCIMQWIPTMFGLCFLASFKNPEREPSIARASSVQIPTTFSQLKASVVVVKKIWHYLQISCAVVLLVSPRQNKKSPKSFPSLMYPLAYWGGGAKEALPPPPP